MGHGATAGVSGMVVGGVDGGRLWLTGAWLLCYCVQFTAARWLRSRFQRRYLPPVLTYAALLAVAGVPLLAMHPLILVWAPLYAVCAGVSFLCAWLRRERSLWANAAAVIATSMMAYVVYAFDAPDLLERTGMGLALAGIFMLTQFGSVLYVKTMIRERRNNRYLAASWIWQAALLALALRGSGWHDAVADHCDSPLAQGGCDAAAGTQDPHQADCCRDAGDGAQCGSMRVRAVLRAMDFDGLNVLVQTVQAPRGCTGRTIRVGASNKYDECGDTAHIYMAPDG